jgi:putative colanic acid biosynthesis UDP-glucose lipid carrier transferase
MHSEMTAATARGLGAGTAKVVGDLLRLPAPAARRVSASDVRLALRALVRAGDIGAAVLAGFAAYWLRHDFATVPDSYGVAILLGSLLAMNAMSIADLYRFEHLQNWRIQVRRGVCAWASVLAALIATAYFMKMSDAFSRAWLAQWFVLALAGFVAIRAMALLLIARWRRYGLISLRVAVIDLGNDSGTVEALATQHDRDIEIVGVFAEIPAQGAVPRTRSFDELTALASGGLVDEIIVVRREVPIPRAIVHNLGSLSVNVRMWNDLPTARGGVGRGDSLASAPMVTIFEQPVSGWKGFAKRFEDLTLSLLVLTVAAPAMLVIAIAIRLDSPGPILYRQQRFGFNGNRFVVLKFRTMVASAGAQSPAQARRGDPRVTRLGRLLRRTSLDELPQLLNVLRGDMSLVGPRPHAVSHNEYYAGLIDGYLARHRVKPGITGWAQVNGLRGETDTLEKMERRVEHDLHYIDNWSLLLDLEILVRTILVGFVHRNAY